MIDAPLLLAGYVLVALVLVWRGSLVDTRATASHLSMAVGWFAVLLGAAALTAVPVMLAAM